MDSATLTAAETQHGWKAWPERNELYFYMHLVKSVSFIYCHICNKRHWDTKGEGRRPRVFWYIGHESSPWLVPSNGGGKGICLWLRDVFYVGLKGTTPSLLQRGLYVHPTRGPWFPERVLELGWEDSNVSAGSTHDRCLFLESSPWYLCLNLTFPLQNHDNTSHPYPTGVVVTK